MKSTRRLEFAPRAVGARRNERLGPWLGIVLLAAAAIGCATGAYADSASDDLQTGINAFNSGAFDVALQEFKPLAKSGNAQAAYRLGQMYENGLGVPKNMDSALSWYEKAADKGLTEAKLRLGTIYFHGTEVLQDFAKAHKWLERAAYDGNPTAQRMLGQLYANGWGVDKDPIWAYVWYELAAEQSDYEAQHQRNLLLKTMGDNAITEAQRLTEKTAGEVFGAARGQAAAQPTAQGSIKATGQGTAASQPAGATPSRSQKTAEKAAPSAE